MLNIGVFALFSFSHKGSASLRLQPHIISWGGLRPAAISAPPTSSRAVGIGVDVSISLSGYRMIHALFHTVIDSPAIRCWAIDISLAHQLLGPLAHSTGDSRADVLRNTSVGSFAGHRLIVGIAHRR